MTYSFSKKQISLAVSCAMALGVVSVAVMAETNLPDKGYVTDAGGAAVTTNYGECWHSGQGPAPSPRIECGDAKTVPAPIAKAEPGKKPVMAAAPAPKADPHKVTLSADTLFDFDKATLRPAGRDALDEFANSIRDINPEMIHAVGHTDRFGSERYNQQLSVQRAEAVKDYLVSRGIEPNRINTEGRGEMQLLTQSGECVGARSAKVIACLQQDRRVDIEVVGMQTAK